MIKFATLLLMLACHVGAGAAAFDLDPEGDKVCKTESDAAAPKTCYQRISGTDLTASLGMKTAIPEAIEVVDEVRAFDQLTKADTGTKPSITLEQLNGVASGLTLSDENRARVVKEFKRLSVRNIAVDANPIVIDKLTTDFGFFASVYWIDQNGLQGTVNVEGTLRTRADKETALNGNDSPEKINQDLAQIFNIQDISDSSTEKRIQALRTIETAARSVHYKSFVGMNADVDAETMALVQNVVGPAVIGKLYVPVMQALVDGFANAIAKALGDALKGDAPAQP